MIDPERYEVEEAARSGHPAHGQPAWRSFPEPTRVPRVVREVQVRRGDQPVVERDRRLLRRRRASCRDRREVRGPDLGHRSGTSTRPPCGFPAMEPLFESKGEIDIYLDLTEEMGVLYGEDGYLAQVNTALKLEEPFALPLDTKPTVRERSSTAGRKPRDSRRGSSTSRPTEVLLKGPLDPDETIRVRDRSPVRRRGTPPVRREPAQGAARDEGQGRRGDLLA